MKHKILIADDDRGFVEMLKERLEVAGYDIVYVYEGIRTVEMAHKEHPDLILLDWLMPAGKGNTVLGFLAKKDDTRHIPVIILTGVSEPGLDEKAAALGAKAVIRKPYDSKQLLQTIEDVIAHKK